MSEIVVPRSLKLEEFEQLRHLLNDVFRRRNDATDGNASNSSEGVCPQERWTGDMLREYSRLLSASNIANLRVVYSGQNQLAAHVGTAYRSLLLEGIRVKAAEIGAVATEPTFRSKGYATILVKDAIERAIFQGADILLISGNRSLYTRFGAAEVANHHYLRFQRTDIDCLNLYCQNLAGYVLRKGNRNDIDAITKLRQKQISRIELPREDIESCFDNMFAGNRPIEWWILEDQHLNVVAYAVAHFNSAKRSVNLIEFGGSSDIFPFVIRQLFEHAYESSDSLSYKAIASNNLVPITFIGKFLKRLCPFHGTVFVLNAKQFLDRARVFIEERIGVEEASKLHIESDLHSVTFRADEEERHFAGAELALLFFGKPSIITSAAPTGEEKSVSRIESILFRIFPISLPDYGIGFV